MPTQPESMKSDMAGNQMCRAGSKIINRAQPWSQTRISVTNKLGIHFSSSWKGRLFSTFGYREIRHCNRWSKMFFTCAHTGMSIVPIGMFAGSNIWRLDKMTFGKSHLIIVDWKERKTYLIIVCLPGVWVEIFRSSSYPVVEGYRSVHLFYFLFIILFNSEKTECKKLTHWSPRGNVTTNTQVQNKSLVHNYKYTNTQIQINSLLLIPHIYKKDPWV